MAANAEPAVVDDALAEHAVDDDALAEHAVEDDDALAEHAVDDDALAEHAVEDDALAVPAVVDNVLAEIAAKEGYRQPSFKVEPGCGARDAYTSSLFRATVHDEDETSGKEDLSLIVKTSKPLFGSLMPRLYAAEDRIYNLVLPAMQEVTSLTEPLPWPRCLHAVIDGPPPQCLVLADLQPAGYGMARCREALDAAHCRLALAALARFHGAGLALQRQRPDAFRHMHAPLENAFDAPEMRDIFEPFVDNLLKSEFAESLRGRFPEGSDVPDVLQRLFATFKEDIGALVAYGEPGEGYTIVHGDCSSNNLLFHYDAASDAVTHCKLIDFQTAHYGCRAMDLASMLLPGTERGVRADGVWDDLLRGYHSDLQDTLRAAGVDDPDAVYSWQLFQAQWRRVVPYGLGFAPMTYAAFCGDDEKILEMQETLANCYSGDSPGGVDVPQEVGLVVNDYVLQRFGDLVEDVARWGLMPTIAEIEGWLESRAGRYPARQSH